MSAAKDIILQALLAYGPQTARKLAVLTKSTRNAVTKALRVLQDAEQIHIVDYESSAGHTSGRMAPIYARGKGKNAAPPKPLTAAQRSRMYRERRK